METAFVPDSSSEAWLMDTLETETVTLPAEIKAKIEFINPREKS